MFKIRRSKLGVDPSRSSDVGAGIRLSATLKGPPPDKRVGADDCADYFIA